MNKVLQTLSLIKRAGKLVSGFDAVKDSLAGKNAKLLAASSGLSPHTLKEVQYLQQKYDVPLLLLDESLDELEYQLGKRSGVFSIIDSGLGEKLSRDALAEKQMDV